MFLGVWKSRKLAFNQQIICHAQEAVDLVLIKLEESAEAMKAGKIAEAAHLDKKVVEKAMKVLIADGRIVSPKYCYWTRA